MYLFTRPGRAPVGMPTPPLQSPAMVGGRRKDQEAPGTPSQEQGNACVPGRCLGNNDPLSPASLDRCACQFLLLLLKKSLVFLGRLSSPLTKLQYCLLCSKCSPAKPHLGVSILLWSMKITSPHPNPVLTSRQDTRRGGEGSSQVSRPPPGAWHQTSQGSPLHFGLRQPRRLGNTICTKASPPPPM